MPLQLKPQDPALLDGASSRFAKAFSTRTIRTRKGGNPGGRPWTWIIGAAALTVCIIAVIFAVASFSSDDKEAASVSEASEGGSARLGDLRGTSAPSSRPEGAGSPGPETPGSVPGGAVGGSGVASGSGTSGGGSKTADTQGSQPPLSGSGTQSNGKAGEPKDGQSDSPSRQPATYSGVQVYSHSGGRCIAASGARSGTAADGTRLVIWDCEGGSWQKIDFRSDGTARMSGLCIDLAWAGQSNGTAIQLAKCNGGWAQKFKLNSAHDLVNTEVGKCVDIVGNRNSNGAALQLWDCAGSDSQKWSKR